METSTSQGTQGRPARMDAKDFPGSTTLSHLFMFIALDVQPFALDALDITARNRPLDAHGESHMDSLDAVVLIYLFFFLFYLQLWLFQ